MEFPAVGVSAGGGDVREGGEGVWDFDLVRSAAELDGAAICHDFERVWTEADAGITIALRERQPSGPSPTPSEIVCRSRSVFLVILIG